MDARNFSHFLTARLKEALSPIEGNILTMVKQDAAQNVNALSRSAGARDILVELIEKMSPLVEEFHNKSNASVANND
jgi:hypothetical protein